MMATPMQRPLDSVFYTTCFICYYKKEPSVVRYIACARKSRRAEYLLSRCFCSSERTGGCPEENRILDTLEHLVALWVRTPERKATPNRTDRTSDMKKPRK